MARGKVLLPEKQGWCDNITIIAAQKIFSFQNLNAIPITEELKNQVWQYQGEDKLAKDNNFHYKLNQDLQNLMSYLNSKPISNRK